MPCNIGYKSYAKIEIPEPQPQTFKAKADAPKIDADLLAKLGNEDPEFLEWTGELDTKSLLEEALKRTLAKVNVKGIKFEISVKGMLEMKSEYFNEKEKQLLDLATSRISERWQFQILGIVAQLLGYTVTITQSSAGEFLLEAEEEGKSHPCNYIKVTKRDGNATLTFEHFKSRGELQLETAKFLTLANKLGVKIVLGDPTISEGDPFPGEELHTHKHGHHHDPDHNHED